MQKIENLSDGAPADPVELVKVEGSGDATPNRAGDRFGPTGERTAGSVGTFCMYRKTVSRTPVVEPPKQRVITVGSIQQGLARETIIPRKLRQAAMVAKARSAMSREEYDKAKAKKDAQRKREKENKKKNRRRK